MGVRDAGDYLALPPGWPSGYLHTTARQPLRRVQGIIAPAVTELRWPTEERGVARGERMRRGAGASPSRAFSRLEGVNPKSGGVEGRTLFFQGLQLHIGEHRSLKSRGNVR
jgi:hypothetical protein